MVEARLLELLTVELEAWLDESPEVRAEADRLSAALARDANRSLLVARELVAAAVTMGLSLIVTASDSGTIAPRDALQVLALRLAQSER